MKFVRLLTRGKLKMTKEGRLARGKENYERKRFLDNQETIDYVATLKSETRETKDVKYNK